MKTYTQQDFDALAALRSVSREQLEKVWRGEWELIGADKRGRGGIFCCTRCCGSYPVKNDFCPHCGAPMTEEAVQRTMERLEALEDAKVEQMCNLRAAPCSG